MECHDHLCTTYDGRCEKCPATPKASNSSLIDGLCVKRLAYIKKLVSEIEEQVDAEMVDIEGDNCIPSKWINVSLLCSVIKKEILRT